MKKSENNKIEGFTLIELLVVISIIGILSSIVLTNLRNAQAKARDTRKVADLRSITNALELYYNQNGSYPVTDAVNPTPQTAFTNCSLSSIGAGYASTNANTPWITGLSSYISELPGQGQNPYQAGGYGSGCFLYLSNGHDYKVSQLYTTEKFCSTSADVQNIEYCKNAPIEIEGGGGVVENYTLTFNTSGAASWRFLVQPTF